MRQIPAFNLMIALAAFTVGALAGAILDRPAGAAARAMAVQLGMLPTPAPQPTTSPPPGIPAAYQGRLRLFLLAGQSNMSGRGSVPEDQPADPRIFLFGNDYRWRLGEEPVDDATGQIDLVSRDGAAGAGPGMAFARAVLAQQPDAIIGLIPCAKGDTTIEQWRPSLDDNTLYGSCLKRVRAASPMGEIAGLLFFQGESDAADPAQDRGRVLTSSGYAEKFVAFVEAMRSDLGETRLPVVFAQIGSHWAPDYYTMWEVVQAEQAAVNIPCVRMITTADLPLQDGVHYTTESYYTIGERFAEAILSIEGLDSCR